jgi:chromosome segregation ATPase
MSKELNYMADLERENRTLKSILYCTKRSCNNCGKVNCENFQRQRIDCCGLWVSYKDYITELENKIADIKANCDLAIEGRDIKIKELELELTVEKDQHQEEINLHLHAEDYIKSLEKENAELRNNGFTVSAMTEQQLKVALEKGEQLEKENAELKEKNKQLNNEVEDLTAYCNQIGKIKTDILKLFEHIVAR